MEQLIYAIFDQKAAAYLPPFFRHADGLAIRDFAGCAVDQEHQFGRNPEDFTLYRIGCFDDETAHIEIEDPHSLGTALEHKAANTKPKENQ